MPGMVSIFFMSTPLAKLRFIGRLGINIYIALVLCLGQAQAKLVESNQNYQSIEAHEIKELLSKPYPQPAAIKKLSETLHSVFYKIDKEIPEAGLHYNDKFLNPFFRVAHWNLSNLDWQRLEILLNNKIRSSTDLELLKSTDIFILNAVDWQTERSSFENNVEAFANLVHGHYAFVPEFIEASPNMLKYIAPPAPPQPKTQINPYLAGLEEKKFKLKLSMNQAEDFKGMHGNAIVTKFPIKQLGKIRLPSCYDWFEEEQKYIEDRNPEKLRREIKDRAGEGYTKELRRGGRVALAAEISLPNGETVIIISTQLENRANPECREMQLYYLLSYIQNTKQAVILGADLNNFEKNTGPFYLGKAIKDTVTDPQVLAKKAISYLNPFAFITNLSSMLIGGYRKKNNPTVSNVPIFMRNKAAKLFKMLEEFEFTDKTKFDFSGIEQFNYSNSAKLLANSNQRGKKGFITTYEYNKLFGKAKTKIDWIFVKPTSQRRYLPINPKTLDGLNHQIEGLPLSDHSPILLDVML